MSHGFTIEILEANNQTQALRRFEPKTMVTIFFRKSGVESLSYLERGKSIINISCIEDT